MLLYTLTITLAIMLSVDTDHNVTFYDIGVANYTI